MSAYSRTITVIAPSHTGFSVSHHGLRAHLTHGRRDGRRVKLLMLRADGRYDRVGHELHSPRDGGRQEERTHGLEREIRESVEDRDSDSSRRGMTVVESHTRALALRLACSRRVRWTRTVIGASRMLQGGGCLGVLL